MASLLKSLFLLQEDVGLQDKVRRSKKRSFSRSILRHDTQWPTGGEVEFRGYATSYRPGRLPDVLKGISFIVRPQEKVLLIYYPSLLKLTIHFNREDRNRKEQQIPMYVTPKYI